MIRALLLVALVAAAATTASGQAPKTYPLNGNLAQLMRGIFFPNSNLIFSVQQRDPATPPEPVKTAAGTPATVFDWGMGIYTGWQVIDNAAIALADVSPLMLSPQLKCENGRMAPVTDPDWIRFTDEMVAVSLRIYKLSQTKNQEAVAEATGDLSDACAACHRTYRDVGGRGRGGGPLDPGSNPNRCLPRASK